MSRPPELAHGILDQVVAVRRIAQVAGYQQAATPGPLDGRLGLHRIGLLLGQVADRDVGALARVQHGHRAPDPGVAAR